MKKQVFQTEIPYTQFINEKNELVDELPKWAQNQELLKNFYKSMVRTRLFDQKAIALQRTGQMGTYPSSLGQEAINVGIGYALEKTDVFFPYYRDHGTQLLRGVTMAQIFQYWGGDERGNLYQGCEEDFPVCVPIATQLCHAAGAASAFKMRGEKRAALVTCGDGATSKGDYLETLNLCGAWQLPLVSVINNNQWAISVPRQIQSGCKYLAQKAVGAGIHAEIVDGNDIIAVHHAVSEALLRARQGKGSTVIEAVTYRLSDHTTADDATRYRDGKELNSAWDKEPIKRLQSFLHEVGFWDKDQEASLIQQATEEINQAVETYLNVPSQPSTDMLDYLYHQLPKAMQEQRDELEEKLAIEGVRTHG